MNAFSQKLRLIYTKMFHENMDDFTKAFIDNNKFHKDRERQEEQTEAQFFLNRKTVLRRWLNKGITCTSDFQKSFKYYKMAHYHFRGEPLFILDDFKKTNNLIEFENRLELYLQYQQRAYVNTDYKYLYLFCEDREEIYSYSIIEWKKTEREEISITLENNGIEYTGTFSLRENNNIFVTLQIKTITLYMLFHDINDSSSPYIVGTSMGYLAKDNKVPRAEKVIFSKDRLDTQDMKLQFILNETERISSIENRLNFNSNEPIMDYFIKYSNIFKNYHNFFRRLVRKKFQQNFYYRLAFREFYAFYRLFEKVSTKETYFVMNYQRAFFEMIKTVEMIQNIPLFIVMDCTSNHSLIDQGDKSIEIKNRFLNLSHYGIETHMVLVLDDIDEIPLEFQELLTEMKAKNIMVRVVEKMKVIHAVNSIDFFFIHLGDKRDFVLADPIRDSKDVYKLFRNEVNMDEYRIDYRRIIAKSMELNSSLEVKNMTI